MGVKSLADAHADVYEGTIRFEIRSPSAQKEGGVHDLHSYTRKLYAWFRLSPSTVFCRFDYQFIGFCTDRVWCLRDLCLCPVVCCLLEYALLRMRYDLFPFFLIISFVVDAHALSATCSPKFGYRFLRIVCVVRCVVVTVVMRFSRSCFEWDDMAENSCFVPALSSWSIKRRAVFNRAVARDYSFPCAASVALCLEAINYWNSLSTTPLIGLKHYECLGLSRHDGRLGKRPKNAAALVGLLVLYRLLRVNVFSFFFFFILHGKRTVVHATGWRRVKCLPYGSGTDCIIFFGRWDGGDKGGVGVSGRTQ